MSRQVHRTPFLQLTAVAYSPVPQNDENSPPLPTLGLDCSSFYHRFLDGEFTIVPDETRLLDVWDATVLLALAYTGTVLPFEVAFMHELPPVLIVTDYVVYWVFVVDMLLTFMVAFPMSRALSNNVYERAPIKIFKHYVNIPYGWFWADLLTVIPWRHMSAFNSIFESMSLLRVFRLVRMVRLVRIAKLTGRWRSRIGISFATVHVLKCVITTTALLHWLSCIWGFLAVSGYEEGHQTWYSIYVLKLEEELPEFAAHTIYATAVYFCAASLTGVGYGDVAPKNLFEIVLSTLTILWTGFMWAGVMAIIINVVTNWDPYANDFQKLSDDLNMLMDSRSLPSNLRTRARKHLQESFEVHRQRFQRETIKALSPGLQVEVAIASGALEVIENVSYLRGIGEDVVTELVSLLEPEMYSPFEFVVDKRSVSVIRSGICWWKTKIITRDAVIGEDMILTNASLRDNVRPRTLTMVELLSLSRADLGLLCSTYPHFNRKIRFAQVRMAVRRGIIRHSQRARGQVVDSKISAIEKRAMFHEEPSDQILATQELVVKEVKAISSELQFRKEQEQELVRAISSELQVRKEQELENQPPRLLSSSHEHREECEEPSTAKQQQAMCCCTDVLEAIDRLARLQEQLRDRIDEALAERRLPQGAPMNNSPRSMPNTSETTAHINLEDEFPQACAGSSSVRWPGSHLPVGETGGSRDAWQQLRSVAMEAQLDALSATLTRSACPGPPPAASMLGGDPTSENELAWLALFQRQSAKIDGLKDSLDLVLGVVRHQVSEALGHGCSGAYVGTGIDAVAQRREDGPVARYRRLTQQLHQQNQLQNQQQQQQQQQRQQVHTPADASGATGSSSW